MISVVGRSWRLDSSIVGRHLPAASFGRSRRVASSADHGERRRRPITASGAVDRNQKVASFHPAMAWRTCGHSTVSSFLDIPPPHSTFNTIPSKWSPIQSLPQPRNTIYSTRLLPSLTTEDSDVRSTTLHLTMHSTWPRVRLTAAGVA